MKRNKPAAGPLCFLAQGSVAGRGVQRAGLSGVGPSPVPGSAGTQRCSPGREPGWVRARGATGQRPALAPSTAGGRGPLVYIQIGIKILTCTSDKNTKPGAGLWMRSSRAVSVLQSPWPSLRTVSLWKPPSSFQANVWSSKGCSCVLCKHRKCWQISCTRWGPG